MKSPLTRTALVLIPCVFLGACATKRTVTTETKRDPMMQHFAGNFETKVDENGNKRSGSDRRSAFENKSYYGTKELGKKSYGKKEFGTKEFRTKEYGRESFAFDGERNVNLKESTLGNQRFEGADKVADTNKTLHDRNKEVVRTPFADADKSAQGRPYREAEKSQQEGDGQYKSVVQPYERSGDPITFSDIKAMLNR